MKTIQEGRKLLFWRLPNRYLTSDFKGVIYNYPHFSNKATEVQWVQIGYLRQSVWLSSSHYSQLKSVPWFNHSLRKHSLSADYKLVITPSIRNIKVCETDRALTQNLCSWWEAENNQTGFQRSIYQCDLCTMIVNILKYLQDQIEKLSGDRGPTDKW